MTTIPVILVTGFLGSGKTTLLRHLAQTHPDWHLVFLVNEYAETSVDGATLAATGTPTQSVVGGSLFCECKAADFVRTMRETVLPRHHTQALDAVVIETSGTADPEAIGKLMDDHGLSEFFELRRIATVVAPAKLPKLLGNLPVIEAQIQASDLIVINKTDTVDETALQAVEASLRASNPNAELMRARHCRIDFGIPRQRVPMPHGDLSTCDANPFSTEEVSWPASRSLDELRDWLAEVPETILRIKGRLQTSEGCWHVERTVDGLTFEPTNEADGRLVLIAHDDHADDLDRVVAGLGCASSLPG